MSLTEPSDVTSKEAVVRPASVGRFWADGALRIGAVVSGGAGIDVAAEENSKFPAVKYVLAWVSVKENPMYVSSAKLTSAPVCCRFVKFEAEVSRHVARVASEMLGYEEFL